jgi:uncharacterized protein (DUF1501 family)
LHDTQFRLLWSFIGQLGTDISHIASSLAQLVAIQKQRAVLEEKHMTIDDSLLQQILDAGNAALLAESNDVAAMAAKDATIASLNAQLAPNPALAASAAAFLANALAANPPAVPVVVPPVVVPPVDVPPVIDPTIPPPPVVGAP